jgi:hypothetical protein
MADVVELKGKRKRAKRRIVNVSFGGLGYQQAVTHVIKKDGDCGVPEGTELLTITTENGEIFAYPITSVYFWSERDHPEDDDIA